jgi:hypothetical protein
VAPRGERQGVGEEAHRVASPAGGTSMISVFQTFDPLETVGETSCAKRRLSLRKHMELGFSG